VEGHVPLQQAGASAPSAPHIEEEPATWQPRALWVAARQLAGASSFFFLSFVFAYFYLRSLDVAKKWKIGHVTPSMGFGIAIVVVLVLSAVLLRLAVTRPGQIVRLGALALVLALASVALQCIEYTRLGFGPASGGYASVFVGWTALYAVFTLACVYWIETQVVTAWRRAREGSAWTAEAGVTAAEDMVVAAGFEACSFFWAYYVAIGILAFVILYLV
jgi:heme/copper-type cytochrome/quinol oxidase subunit 3